MKRLVATLVVLSSGVLSGADLESEARAIEAMLIAPCCFSQQVSLHHSAAADEVKRDVRARLAAGQTRHDIIDAYVAQYGKRILAEPPAEGFDVTLYLIPLATLLLSAVLLVWVVRRFVRPRLALAAADTNVASVATSADAEARLDDELRDLD